jgi:RNA polymerase sigma factor (sigma-70 family)
MGASAVTPAAPARRGPLGGVSARLLRVASDEKLVAAVRQGSQPAFEVLYDRHHRGILSFCRHMLGSREEAEDALQHTYMAAYKALLASDKDIQLKAWLYTIARNRCLSVLRARREHPSDEIEIASFHGLAAEVEQKVELQDMLRDLAELPEDQRAALVLSEIGDLGHDEIGDVLDVPKDKVKALVFQARSSLQQSREARDTSCEDIREMLATLSGGALRRTTIRRHVKECAGCQAFEADVKRQRRAMAAVLPVVPTLGLKDSALAAAFGQTAAGGAVVAGGAAAGAGAGGILGGGASALVAKVLVVTAVAGGGAAGVSAVSDGGGSDKPRSAPATESSNPSGGGGAAPAVAPAATAAAEKAEEKDAKAGEDKPRKNKKARRRGHNDRGKAFAETRGKGKKRGLRGTQPGKTAKEKAKEKAEKRKASEKSAQQKATSRAKARAKSKARSERPAKPPANPPRREKPKNENSQKPAPEPEPEPEPQPEPTPEITPTPESTPGGRSKP